MERKSFLHSLPPIHQHLSLMPTLDLSGILSFGNTTAISSWLFPVPTCTLSPQQTMIFLQQKLNHVLPLLKTLQWLPPTATFRNGHNQACKSFWDPSHDNFSKLISCHAPPLSNGIRKFFLIFQQARLIPASEPSRLLLRLLECSSSTDLFRPWNS